MGLLANTIDGPERPTPLHLGPTKTSAKELARSRSVRIGVVRFGKKVWPPTCPLNGRLSVAKLSAKRIFSLAKRDFLVANGRMAADFSSPATWIASTLWTRLWLLFLEKVGWDDSLPLHDVQELLESDEISKWLQEFKLCHRPDVHIGWTRDSRENCTFPTTLQRGLGKEFSSPRPSTSSVHPKLAKKPTQAYLFEESHSKHRGNGSTMDCHALMRRNCKSCSI